MEEPYRKYSDKRDELLYETGIQFLDLGKKGFERKGDIENFEPQPFASIVNIAFSIELFLKYLIESNGQKGWGHDLLNLLNQLNDKQKQIIYISIFASYARKGKEELLKGDKMGVLLKNHSKIFEDFRYLYEDPGKLSKIGKLDFAFLMDFAVIVKGVCEDERKKNLAK